jgi:hypothetical protein
MLALELSALLAIAAEPTAPTPPFRAFPGMNQVYGVAQPAKVRGTDHPNPNPLLSLF